MSDPTPTFRSGQRVRYVGFNGRGDGATGRVSRVVKAGVKVRWDDGADDIVHPDGLQLIEPKAER